MEDINIFVSYSHSDSRWIYEGDHGLIPWLEKSLKREQIHFWYDHDLKSFPFVEFKKKIKEELIKSHLAILLLSQDFLISDFIRDYELPWIKERIDQKNLAILPILVAPLDWEGEEDLKWISEWQILPGKPTPLINYLTDLAKWSQVRVDLMKSIKMRVNEMRRVYQISQNKPETILLSKKEEANTVLKKPELNELGKNNLDNDISGINLLQKLDIHASNVTLNSDGSKLAGSVSYGRFAADAVGFSGEVEIWDLKENKLIKSNSKDMGLPIAITFSPDDKYIAIGSREKNKTLLLWDYKSTNKPYILINNYMEINTLLFSQDSKILFCAGDKSIMIWDVEKGTLITELTGHTKSIRDLAIDQSGNVLASTTVGAEVGIWNMTSYKNIEFLNINFYGRKVVFGSDNEIIALGLETISKNEPSKILIYNIDQKCIVKTLNGLKGLSIEALAFNRINGFLVSGSMSSYTKLGGSIRIYDFNDNLKLVKSFDFKPGGISDLAFSSNGKILASSQIEPEPFKGMVTNYSVRIWNGF